MVFDATFKADKNGNIRLASRLYLDVLGGEVFTLWGGDPEEAGAKARERLQSFRFAPIELLALLRFIKSREKALKDEVVRIQLEREGRSY